MREIKFRAWHKKHLIMAEWPLNELDVMETDFQFVVDGERFASDYSLIDAISYDGIEVMQYTGLEDKNGKEIYEGDLVLVRDVRICEIVFHEQAGCWDLELRNALSSLSIGPVAPASWKYHVEIIGNIHENRDLIK
jgi:uncharacterized phage protein (TIGR01671 family)